MSTKISKFVSKRRTFSASAIVAVAGLSAQAMAGGGSGFVYPDFSSTAGLVLNGHAVQTTNVIDLNGSVVAGSRSGSVWHSSQQNISLGFTTNFKFRITDVNGAGGGGFAFVIQNSNSGPSGTASFGTSALGAAGGALGYASNLLAGGTNPGINRSIVIELDTYTFVPQDLAPADFVGDHFALYNWGETVGVPLAANSMDHVVAQGTDDWSTVSDGQVYDVRASYIPGLLQVFIKRETDAVFGPAVMSTALDMAALIPLNPSGEGIGQAWVGFTAGTGGIQDFERHQILSWDFTGSNIPTPGAMALVALGGLFATRRRNR